MLAALLQQKLRNLLHIIFGFIFKICTISYINEQIIMELQLLN